jgi:hypothetical protein
MRFRGRLRRLEAKRSPVDLEHLSDEELDDLIAYVTLSLQEEPSQAELEAAEARLSARGRACHEAMARETGELA